MTPKQLQDFIDAPRALAALLEGHGHADVTVRVAQATLPSVAPPRAPREHVC